MASTPRLTSATRRALAKGVWVEDVDKRQVYAAFEGLCGLCGELVAYGTATLDHIVPLSRGGVHAYENVQLAHRHCNQRKGNRLPDELDDELRDFSAPKRKRPPYYNSKSYRAAQVDQNRRAA